MSLVPQIRQVLRRDALDARWLLLAYGVTLCYAVVQGRSLLRPQPLLDELFVLGPSDSFLPSLLTLVLLLLLSATLALHFAPRTGRTTHAAQAWLTLPIAPQAVWSVRMLWIIGAFVASLVVTWLVLLPLPISVMTRFRTAAAIALNSSALLLAGTLFALAAGSLRRLLWWMIATVVAVPVLGLVLEALPVEPSISDRVELVSDSLRNLSVPLLGLLLVGSVGVYLALRARHLAWWARAAAAGLAVLLVVVNAGRAPAPPRPPARDALPSMLTLTGAEASLSSTGVGILMSAPVGVSSAAGAITMDTAAARRAAVAAMASSLPEDGARQYTMVLHPNATAVHTADRLVLRTRSASVRSADGTYPFRTTRDQSILTAGDPLPGRPVRWLNQLATDEASLFAFGARRADSGSRAAPTTAEFVVDVERRQPLILATHPLDGSAPSGPWHPFIGVRVPAPSDSQHTLLVHLNRPTALYAGGQSTDLAVQDVTFALLHEQRGEALHLGLERRFSGSLGWALAPTLLDGLRGGLRPVGVASSGTTATAPGVAPPDTAWLRGASLIVVGWHTVERGALAIAAPLVDAPRGGRTAMR